MTIDQDHRPPFFGEPWDAPAVDGGVRVPTPVGRPCVHCTIEVVEGDRGTFVLVVADAEEPAEAVARREPVHLECAMRAAIGPVSHLEGRCTCATDPVRPRTAWRQEGLDVLAWLEKNHR